MARPCGCAGGGCNARGINGIEVTGTCGINDPLTIGLADDLGAGCEPVMDCVGSHLNAGLVYSDDLDTISVRISGDAGNQATFGSDGGVFASGMPDPGIGGVTVASLPAENVLGGSYGAGYAQWPEGTLEAYEQAMLIESLHMVHVPARRSEEQMIYALDDRQLITYSPVSASQTTDVVDQREGHYNWVLPSGPAGGANGDEFNPLAGYFGFAYPQVRSYPTLADVFRTTQRRKVLYIQNKDLGTPDDTVSPLFSIALSGLLAQSWGLQKSVIIGSELPPGASQLQSIKDGLTYCKNLNIEIAAHILNDDHATANPAADLTALGCTWVFCAYAVNSTHINEYKTAGLQVMMFNADRQTHWAIQRSLGVRGALSSDPVYTAAATYGYRYRRVNPPTTIPHPWSSVASADYGRIGYSGSIAGAHAKFRGYVGYGQGGMLQFPPAAAPPTNPVSSYLIPPGRWCPIYDPDNPNPPIDNPGAPTNYDIDIGVSATVIEGSSTGMAMGVFFGNPEDHRLFDLNAARTTTKGYSFVLATDGNFVFRRYDGNEGTIDYNGPPWASGWGNLAANTEYRIGVQVRPGTVRVGPLTANGGITGPNSRLFDATVGGGDLWRGGYMWLMYNHDTTYTGNIRFHNLYVRNLA